jgi:hypothetical protein
VKINIQPHKNQLEDRMIEGKGNNMGKVENMGVINQGKRHEGKLFEEQHKTQK